MAVRTPPDSPARDWRAWRLSVGLTLPEAARRAGINRGILSDIENRERRVRPDYAQALTDVYREAEKS